MMFADVLVPTLSQDISKHHVDSTSTVTMVSQNSYNQTHLLHESHWSFYVVHEMWCQLKKIDDSDISLPC